MKRIMTTLVILLMATTVVFVGCKKQTQQEQAQAPTLTSSGKLLVEMFDRGTDGGRTLAYDNAWTDWIKAKVKKDLGFDVTFQAVGRWSENTDIINMMAGRNAPDLCYTYNGPMIDNFRDYGGILNLAPHIDTYLPDLKETLGADPVFPGKDFIRRDEIYNTGGAIFKIASARVALAQRNIFIRKDWLDKLGLAVPKTIDEFYNALVAFRDRDPGGVGANRVIPYYQGTDARWGLADLIGNSLTAMSDRDIWINSAVGQAGERSINKPGFKEGVRLMNTWYNEKLIYQDFPLANTEDGNNLLKSGVAGAFAGNWDLPYRTDYSINGDLAKNVPGASFIAVDLNLKNKAMLDKVGLYMFVPTYSKSQKEALQYLNWIGKYENYHYLQVGEQGRNHNIVNGVPQIINSTDPKWIQNSTQNIDITMPLNGVFLGSDEENTKVLALSYQGTPAETISQAYAISVKEARAAVVHGGVIKVTQYTQTLEDKADQLISQAITAAPAQFDAIWDAGLRDWMASGAQEVINERTALWPK
jgi:putative aldouronate transport system substrate-binding protein